MNEIIVALDVETTGLDIHQAEIIEFGAWRIEKGQPPQSLHFLVRPCQKVPPEVLRLTGINEEELAAAQPLAAYREEILTFLHGAVLVGHNVQFDIGFLEKGLGMRLVNAVWDTLDMGRIFFPSLKHYKLAALVAKLAIELPEPGTFHRASSDAWAAWKVLEACWRKGLEYDLSFYAQARQFVDGWSGRSFLLALEKEIGRSFPARPIRTDLVLAQYVGLFQGQGTEQGAEEVPEQPDWVVSCFKPGGILEQSIDGYESRDGQVKMAQEGVQALFKPRHLVVEAGTGTGKSFAYLIPSIWWAKRSGKKVIVATHTIPLQEQLKKKDLPVLHSVLPFSFKSALLKGKGNYCCLKNWLSLPGTAADLTVEEALAALSISTWLRETVTGDMQELPQGPGLQRIWARVSAESEICVPTKCPQAGECFLLRARQQAEEADLVIVNHSLLFSDIKTDYKVLPEYQYLVVDEVHHLYHSALEQLGDEFSTEQIARVVERIYRPAGPSLYGNIKVRSSHLAEFLPMVSWDRFLKRLEEMPAACSLVLEQARELFQLFQSVIGERSSLRLVTNHREERWWGVCEAQVENLVGRIKSLVSLLEGLTGVLSGEDADEIEALQRDLGGFQRELEQISDGLSVALQLDTLYRVTWLEKGTVLSLKTSPVDISSILKEKIFGRLDSAILTSATISIADSFEHFLAELGLPASTRTVQVESPFDYERQMRFYVVKGILGQRGTEGVWAEDAAEFIAETAERMGGRTLVLFTSHRFLRTTHAVLKEKLERKGLAILAQGIEGGRGAILEEFLRNPRSVLMGANSFWEGIDIPGDALSCVILVKLPFWPPSMPLIEARTELLEAQGRNSFQELMLPEAVIRFKQGFGRLIRSRKDRGVVVLLDSRAIEKYYGKLFLASLPVKTHERGEKEHILGKIDAWFNSESSSEDLF